MLETAAWWNMSRYMNTRLPENLALLLESITDLDFAQDPEPSSPSASPNFIIKLNNDDELTFNFTFIIRQTQKITPGPNGAQDGANSLVDTVINGLTYVSASTAKEVETLVTREFHADPNLHKNANVQLVGDYSTGGSSSVSFEWSWKWRPPKPAEDRGGGWRNNCSVCFDVAVEASLLTF
jgi:Arf-GAP/SH3 domain/ANK repeat/PH domain-containing protein